MDIQTTQTIVVIVVAIVVWAISKRVFKLPECYWPYRIYVIVVVALWVVFQVL